MAISHLTRPLQHIALRTRAYTVATFLFAVSIYGRPAAGADASCVGLREGLFDATELAKRRGNWPDDASMYESDSSSWTRIARYTPSTGSVLIPPSFNSPPPSTPECPEATNEKGDLPCTKCLDRVFSVDGDTVAFTIGRRPESCSEAPRMRWQTHDGRRHEVALPPLFGFNVSALWCTGHHLIMGLEASYEYGDSNQTVAFWDLNNGRFSIYPYGASHLPISDYLPEWTQARATSTDTMVVLNSTRSALAFWPEAKQWSILDVGTGRALPDPVKEVVLPGSVPASVMQALREAIPKAIGFTPVKAYEIDGITVVVYRADAERIFSQEQWFDQVEGYVVARSEAGKPNGTLIGVVVDPYLRPDPRNVHLQGYWNEKLVFSFRGDKGSRVEQFLLR